LPPARLSEAAATSSGDASTNTNHERLRIMAHSSSDGALRL
jgi:hypothetical protein